MWASLDSAIGLPASTTISRNARAGYSSPTGLRSPAVETSTAMPDAAIASIAIS